MKYSYIPEPLSIYKKTKKLPAGSYIKLKYDNLINNEKISVWLIPSIIWGNARGISIAVHLCILETPDIEPASWRDTGTLFNPSIVYLVAGIVA